MDTEIIPAVMPTSLDNLASMVLLVRHSVDNVQIDIMDGEYVQPTTWPFMYARDLDVFRDPEFAFPLWETMNYELDLMVRTPERDIQNWISLGASRIVFHYASVHDWKPIADIDQVIKKFTSFGVAVTIYDPIEKIYELIDNEVVDYVQVMGIARIGYQGEPFVPEILDIVEKLRSRYPNMPISVDGGVNLETIDRLYQAGVDRFVAGSAVFGGGIPHENIEFLYGALGHEGNLLQ
jgi:ribulose-phosphate 3-epimerase